LSGLTELLRWGSKSYNGFLLGLTEVLRWGSINYNGFLLGLTELIRWGSKGYNGIYVCIGVSCLVRSNLGLMGESSATQPFSDAYHDDPQNFNAVICQLPVVTKTKNRHIYPNISYYTI